MLNFKSATVLSRSTGAQWNTLDISPYSLTEVFSTLSKIYLTLQDTDSLEYKYVDFTPLRSLYSGSEETIIELLKTIDTTIFTFVDSVPNTKIKYARYSNTIQAGYKVELANIKLGNIPPSDKDNNPDLKISRPNYSTDITDIFNYCLVSVNGYFHNQDSDSQYAYIVDGGVTGRHTNDNHVGILSFLNVGKLNRIKLKEENINPINPGDRLKDKLYFHVEEDLSNKQVLLVLGGYLILPQDDVFYRTGMNTFALNLTGLNILEKVMESSFYLDLSSLGLSKRVDTPDLFSAEEFLTDEIIKKYLTLSQSFLVSIDTDNLIFNKYKIETTHGPGKFLTGYNPTLPLFVNYGKCAEYSKVYEGPFWSVTVRDSYMHNFVLTHKNAKHHLNITAQRIPSRTYHNSEAYLLEIGTEKA